MNTYTALCTVPRKYIDVVTLTERDVDSSEFWGRSVLEPVIQYVDRFSVDTLGFLHSYSYSREEAIELDNFDRNSMNITFKFECAEQFDDEDGIGEWLENKLPGDWHTDEILEIQQGVAA